MDIPTPDTVQISSRAGEGPYGPILDAARTSTACVQETASKTITSTGETVMCDLFVILPPETTVSAGDALEYDGRSFDVVGVERLKIGASEHHVELLCKSRASE